MEDVSHYTILVEGNDEGMADSVGRSDVGSLRDDLKDLGVST